MSLDSVGEPSPVISPWNTHLHGRPGSTSSNESSSGGSTGVSSDLRVSSSVVDNASGHWHHQDGGGGIHPFTQRAQRHYSQRQQQSRGGGHYQQQVRGLLAAQSNNNHPMQQPQQNGDVVITSSRGGGVTISPAALGAAQEINFSSSAAAAFSLPTQQQQQQQQQQPFSYDGGRRRYLRSESADRLMMVDNEFAAFKSAATPAKKHSAPLSGVRHNRSAATLGGRDDEQEDLDFLNGNLDARSLDESFRKIIARADSSINQAESILSSLRAEKSEIPPISNSPHRKTTTATATTTTATAATRQPAPKQTKKASPELSEEGSEPASLGSDIETNIRRLEKTQAKINAALETFRSVQAMSGGGGCGSTQQHQGQHRHHRSSHYPGVELRSRCGGGDAGEEVRPHHGHHRHHHHHRAFVLNERAIDVGGEDFGSFPVATTITTRTVGVTAAAAASASASEGNRTLPAGSAAEPQSPPSCKSRTAPGNLEQRMERKKSSKYTCRNIFFFLDPTCT